MAQDRTKVFRTKGEWFWNPTAIIGTNGVSLGFTLGGVTIDWGEEIVEETVDEYGANVEQMFFAGQNLRLNIVLRQFHDDVIKNFFANQYDATDKRIEIPGDRVVGDSIVEESGILVFVPDNPFLKATGLGKDLAIVAFKAVCKKVDTTMISNGESRMLPVEFLCMEDRTITSGDRLKYRTFGMGPQDELSVT